MEERITELASADAQKTELFERTPIPQAVMKMAVPTVLSSLVMVIYNLADTVLFSVAFAIFHTQLLGIWEQPPTRKRHFILPFGFGMGAAGAGLATFLSNCAACIYFFALLWVRCGQTFVCVDPRVFSFDTKIIGQICAVGVPAAENFADAG